MGALSNYKYAAIPPGARTFRAIRLLDRLGSWSPWLGSGTLRLRVEEVKLDSQTPYECLSYTWGNTVGKLPDCRVVVETANGPQQLLIYRSLEVALLQMMDNGHIPGLIFVDQICLDQSNDLEKADQVPLMRDIYAQSTRTLVWLGQGTILSNRWFDFVEEIQSRGILSRLMGPNLHHFMKAFDAVMDETIPTTGALQEDTNDLRSLMDQYSKHFPLKALEDVFKRSWFSRLWIIQEACLPAEVTFICGTRSLCIDCFRAGNLFFSIYSSYLPRQKDWKLSRSQVALHWETLELVQKAIRIYQERRAIHVAGVRQNSIDAVIRYSVAEHGSKVEVARDEDRIFGLMGLMAPEDEVHGIEVRYNDVSGIYTEFAAIHLQKNPDLLCYSQFPKRNDLPSWVSDWAVVLHPPRGYINLKEPRFSAGSTLRPTAQVEVDLAMKTLIVKGVQVDRIAKVGNREMTKEMEMNTTDQVDPISAYLFLVEVDEFLQLLSAMPESGFCRLNPSEEQRADAGIRLADRGLSERYLLGGTLTETEIRVGLRAARSQAFRHGKKLFDVQKLVQSYDMNRVFERIGFVPWYWVPGGNTDICHAMAINPLATSFNWVKGVAMFLTDVLVLGVSFSVLLGVSQWLKYKKKWERTAMFSSQQEQTLRKHGLDATVDHRLAFSTLGEYMLKNREQRLYVTEHGHIGLGPREMQPDDVVVVLAGGTVPHVLRLTKNGAQGYETWSYLGEAYCDGIMDGELFKEGETSEVRTFRIR